MKKKQDIKKLSIIAAAAIVLVAAVYFIYPSDKGESNKGDTDKIAVAVDSDIVIQTKDVTEQPSFYPANIDGTDLEVIAVKATDGTIRTAFNTCQVCYGSGKGYYEVEGNELVCQNCGNRFGMDVVGEANGGCNPVPIASEYKTENDEAITISKDFLTEATVIFDNWK